MTDLQLMVGLNMNANHFTFTVDNVNIVSASTNGVKQISTIGVKRSEEISQMNGNGIDADHTPVSMVAS